MFDWFNRKRLKAQDAYIGNLIIEIADLKTTLREQDQQIYNMSQCADWPSMQRHFASLLTGTEERRRIESDRIAENIIAELNKL